MPLGQCRVDFNINLQEVEILLCQGLIDKPTATAINKALRLRRITGVERRQLLPLDIIAKATDIKTRETSHFMVSVFRITHSVDRQRAAVPASICAKSLDRLVQPLAVGCGVHPGHAGYIETSPFSINLHPWLGPKA